MRRKTTSKGKGALSRCRRGVRSFYRRKQRFGRFPGPRRPKTCLSTGQVRCHYSPLLSYGPRRRPAGLSPCRGSPSPARRQGWAQPARGGGGGAGVREWGPETRPRRSWLQGKQPDALRSLAPPNSPPSTWRGRGEAIQGWPLPNVQDSAGVLGQNPGGTAAPSPHGDANPRPDSRFSVPAATAQRQHLLGPLWHLDPRAPPPLAPLPTHTAPALLQPRRPDFRRLATARMRPTPAATATTAGAVVGAQFSTYESA